MAESNATQVILTDDGIKIIKAQNTADSAASGVTNLNDPNLMSVIEKQHLKIQMDNFATIYTADKDIATAEGIDFSTYDAAYHAYLAYTTPLVADMTTYSPIVRATFNSMVAAVQAEQKRFNAATQAQYNQQINKAQTDISDGQTKYKDLLSEAKSMEASAAGISDAADRAISSAGFASTAASAASQAVSEISQTIHGIQTTVSDKASSSQLTQLSNQLTGKIEDLSSSAASSFRQTASDIDEMVKKGDVVTQFNIDAGGALLSTSGKSTKIVFSSPNIIFDTDNPVQIPNANIPGTLTGKTFEAGTITAKTKITGTDIEAPLVHSPSGSFKLDGNTGDIVGASIHSADNSWGIDKDGNINGTTINGSTINGTTFHGGDVINNGNNTAGYYPMTITPDGAYKSTYFDGAVGLQSSVESGAISYKYRSMVNNSSGQYLAYDSVINGQGFQSQSGYTSAKDTTFSNPETVTGYVNVTPATGIYLYGPTQQINFAGRSDNIGSNGITMDAYGNIYAQSNSAWWRIGDVNGNQIINFGIDKAGSNAIQFKRDLWVSNMGLGTGHQVRSNDGRGIYFTDSNSNRVDTYHNNIYYSGSISKSLLSEKTNVTVADVNYWSNLAMSIDLATYNYKTDDYTDPLRLSGIIDDVNTTKEWTLPEAFYARDEGGNIVGIDNGVLLNAVLALSQEQAKQIDKLNGHSMELEARLNKLEVKLNG